MIVTPLPVAGAHRLDIERREDDRGFLARAFCEEELPVYGIEMRVAQGSIVWTRERGTLRGLHYQAAPHEEAKIVRCTRGRVRDVIVDLRVDSPSCMLWHGEELDASSHRMIHVPAGCAHGYLTLTDDTEMSYFMGHRYEPASARGVRWDDPAFAITWPFAPTVISARDRAYDLIQVPLASDRS